MNHSGTGKITTASGSALSPGDVRQALLSMETTMRMFGKAIHRFSQLQTVRQELRHDIEWTGFEVQMKQALANVKDAVAII